MSTKQKQKPNHIENLRPKPKPGDSKAVEEFLAARLVKWRRSMAAFARDVFKFEPTDQQLEAMAAVDGIIEARLLRFHGQPIPEKLKKYDGKFGISIMSGQGTGKGAFGALLMWFFLVCFPRAKGMATAPAGHQLKSVLWAEASGWVNRLDERGEAMCVLRDVLKVQSEKIYVDDGQPGAGKDSFFEARTCNPNTPVESQAETLAGRHADYMVILADEASKVPDAVFKPIEGTLTGRCNFAVVLFNPTRRLGYAIKTHYGEEKDMWVRLHWDAEQSPRVPRHQIERMEKKYGRGSNPFRVRVLGLPPTVDDGSVIPWEWANEASEREIEVPDAAPVIMGVDPGRGGDPTAIYVRKGPRGFPLVMVNESDLVKVAARVLQEIEKWEPDAVNIGVCGIGWGVYDIVKQQYSKCFAVNEAGASSGDKFDRMRDEMWWRTRERFQAGIETIPKDDELIDELSAFKYDDKVNGKIKIESKRALKARCGGESPNKADALVLTHAFAETTYLGEKNPDDDEDEYDRKGHGQRVRHSWLTG